MEIKTWFGVLGSTNQDYKQVESRQTGKGSVCDVVTAGTRSPRCLFSTLGMTNICQLLSISLRVPAALLVPPDVPQRPARGLRLIAQIIQFNSHLNTYNQPAV